jgi:cytochrome d ubiquinol oxidase subunit II
VYIMIALIFVATFATLAIVLWPFMIPSATTISEAASPC